MKNKSFVILLISLAAIISVAAVVYKMSVDSKKPVATDKNIITYEDKTVETQNEGASDGEAEVLKGHMIAPDFTVYTEDGESVKLSDFKGKPTVINFWATWCRPCVSELPHFQNKYDQLKDKVNFVMINSNKNGQNSDDVKKFLSDNGYTFPMYYDSEYDGAMTYGVNSIPLTLFIYDDGSLYGGRPGAMSKEELAYHINIIRGVDNN